MERYLVPILATFEALAPLANDPIMLGRSIWLFRPPKHKNLSTGDEFIHNSGIFCISILATKETLASLENDLIMSGDQFCHLDTMNVKIHLSFQIL